MSENQPQIDYWNGDVGKIWATRHAILDANLSRFSEAVLAFAAAKQGEHVLDVGCGTGDATVALAKMITHGGAPGKMLGADISAPMLATARERAKTNGLTEREISFVEADASVHPFDARSFDLTFSRFGVMFFADPVRAFKNLHRATRGRLAFVCWQPIEKNAWAHVPLAVGRSFLPPPHPASPDAPGPFALANQSRLEKILAEAGWRDISITPVDRPMTVGTTGEDAADFTMSMGPLSRALREANDPAINAKVREKLVTVLGEHARDGQIMLAGAGWLVGANA